ncbi:MAG TPA: aspartyl protease family protein, partial [Steroidobacteraceae bacterium]|nr:aspartyl protease family protein [Steroidobacteraceae bacterium]
MNASRLIPLLLMYLPLQVMAAVPATAIPDDDIELQEVIVHAPEPRYVAPTTRDRIGRVWVPVYLNDKGPFRLVLDSGATRTALVPSVITTLELQTGLTPPVMLRGVTGTA